MSTDLTIDGLTYISSKRAAEIAGYSQDYVGQLARGGKIVSKRVGGLWYVLADSILEHKNVADSYVPEQPKKGDAFVSAEDASSVTLDGRMFVSAARASKLTSYHPDYIGQLARSGKILSQQVGKRWYVDVEALKSHKAEKDALLGAVQTESVGLRRGVITPATDTATNPIAEEVGLHYTYKNDEKPLFPPVKLANYAEIASVESSENSLGALRDSVVQTNIPIRVLRPTQRIDKAPVQTISEERSASRTPRIAIFSKLFPIFAASLTLIFVFNMSLTKLPEVVKQTELFRGINMARVTLAGFLPQQIIETASDLSHKLFSGAELRYTREN